MTPLKARMIGLMLLLGALSLTLPTGAAHAQYKDFFEGGGFMEFAKNPQKYVGQMVKFQDTFRGFLEPIDPGDAERLHLSRDYLKFQTRQFGYLYAPKSQSYLLEKLKKGDDIEVYGRIGAIFGDRAAGGEDFSSGGQAPMIVVDRIEKKLHTGGPVF